MLKVIEGGFEPVRSTKYSAYVDLFSAEDATIGAGETKVVKLGIKLDLDELNRSWYFYTEQNKISGSWDMYLRSHYLEIALRSSLAVKGLIIANGTGKVDLDYPDEIGLIVHNPIKENFISNLVCKMIGHRSNHYNQNPFTVSKGDKVAQCTLKEHKGYLMGYESDVIRVSGFGSTGK
jgi:dUTPase